MITQTDAPSRLTIVDETTGRRRSEIRWPDGQPPPLDGCRRCGHREVMHPVVPMAAGPGYHLYEPPTRNQHRHRLLAWAQVNIRRMIAEELDRVAPAERAADSATSGTAGRGVFEPARRSDAEPLQWGAVADPWAAHAQRTP